MEDEVVTFINLPLTLIVKFGKPKGSHSPSQQDTVGYFIRKNTEMHVHKQLFRANKPQIQLLRQA